MTLLSEPTCLNSSFPYIRLLRPAAISLAIGVASVTLSGCAPLLLGSAAATTVVVATDRRTAGEQVEDQSIELKAAADIRKAFADNDNVRVNVTSYAGLVLLTGDVPNETDKQKAGQVVQGVENVKRVVNEIRVGPVTPLSVRTNDTWITSKVRSALIGNKEIPSLTIVATTERGVVYLLGKVTERESKLAANAAASITGVNQVVTLFDIVSPESVASGNTPAAADNASRTPGASTGHSAVPVNDTPVAPGTGTSGDSSVQTMPIM